jgi:antitoxin (DNA-binding transcriptional repressor) of toxin-antitoxin stability system
LYVKIDISAPSPLNFNHEKKKVKKEPFIITKEGKPVAALVSIINADIETVSLSSHPKFIALIERSRLKQKAEGGLSTEEMRQRLEKPKRSAQVR